MSVKNSNYDNLQKRSAPESGRCETICGGLGGYSPCAVESEDEKRKRKVNKQTKELILPGRAGQLSQVPG